MSEAEPIEIENKTPPPRASKRSKVEVPAEESGEKKVRKTFARRYRPGNVAGMALYDSIQSAFVGIVSVQIRAPSKMEVRLN